MANTNKTAERLVTDLMRELDLTREQALGFVGNLAHESAGFKKLEEVGPGKGYGYAQWTGPRRTAFESWSKKQGLEPSSYEANLGFIVKEMKGPERSSLARIKKADTADKAATVAMNSYFRPGVPHLDSRKDWTSQFASSVPQNAALSAIDQVAPIPATRPPGLGYGDLSSRSVPTTQVTASPNVPTTNLEQLQLGLERYASAKKANMVGVPTVVPSAGASRNASGMVTLQPPAPRRDFGADAKDAIGMLTDRTFILKKMASEQASSFIDRSKREAEIANRPSSAPRAPLATAPRPQLKISGSGEGKLGVKANVYSTIGGSSGVGGANQVGTTQLPRGVVPASVQRDMATIRAMPPQVGIRPSAAGTLGVTARPSGSVTLAPKAPAVPTQQQMQAMRAVPAVAQNTRPGLPAPRVLPNSNVLPATGQPRLASNQYDFNPADYDPRANAYVPKTTSPALAAIDITVPYGGAKPVAPIPASWEQQRIARARAAPQLRAPIPAPFNQGMVARSRIPAAAPPVTRVSAPLVRQAMPAPRPAPRPSGGLFASLFGGGQGGGLFGGAPPAPYMNSTPSRPSVAPAVAAQQAQGLSPSQAYAAANTAAQQQAIANSANPERNAQRASLASQWGFD